MENRRVFLKNLAGITAAVTLPISQISARQKGLSDKWGEVLPKRRLGFTGEEVTMLGLGGYHVGWTTEKDAQEVIETAIEGGIRFFDTAESYGPHTSEIRYGKYLTPKYRDEIFLMTKSTAKDATTMRAHLEASLKRLKTDYLDLWQVHSIMDPADVDSRINNGVIDVVVKAKEEGKVKHIGFTGHNNPAAHRHMLEQTASNPVFETIQMPINVVDANHPHFINTVLPKALERKMGILAMKTMADGRFFSKKMRLTDVQWQTDKPVVPDRLSVREALYFVWSLPVSVLITGAENKLLVQEKISLAKRFSTLSTQDRMALIEKVSDLAEEGKVEYYKHIN